MPERQEGSLGPDTKKYNGDHYRANIEEDIRLVIDIAQGNGGKIENDFGHNGILTIEFKPDGTVKVNDPEEGVIEISADQNAHDTKLYPGNANIVESIREATLFLERIVNTIPSGNLDGMGGTEGILRSHFVVQAAEACYKASKREPKGDELPFQEYDNFQFSKKKKLNTKELPESEKSVSAIMKQIRKLKAQSVLHDPIKPRDLSDKEQMMKYRKELVLMHIKSTCERDENGLYSPDLHYGSPFYDLDEFLYYLLKAFKPEKLNKKDIYYGLDSRETKLVKSIQARLRAIRPLEIFKKYDERYPAAEYWSLSQEQIDVLVEMLASSGFEIESTTRNQKMDHEKDMNHDRTIANQLKPEIDRLNEKLVSMGSYRYYPHSIEYAFSKF